MTRTEKLLRLADHLEQVVAKRDPGRFNLLFVLLDDKEIKKGDIFGYGRRIDHNFFGVDDTAIRFPVPLEPVTLYPGGCGYAACALGEAPGILEFRQLGLIRDEDGEIRVEGATNNLNELERLRQFFELDSSTFRYLFMPDEYDVVDDPLLVANRIRDVVAEKRSAGKWA